MDEKQKIKFKKLGKQIKRIRESKGICLNELSVKSGIRKAYLQIIEKGIAYGVLL